MSSSVISSSVTASASAPTIRCHTAGRVRGFIRNRILLAFWQPHALPHASGDAAAAQQLAHLVGPAMLAPMHDALSHVGGCARDAYTVLYACAALAVLFAACGVATERRAAATINEAREKRGRGFLSFIQENIRIPEETRVQMGYNLVKREETKTQRKNGVNCL